MTYAIEGGVVLDAAWLNTSQLSRITERMRRIGRWFIDVLNQRGEP